MFVIIDSLISCHFTNALVAAVVEIFRHRMTNIFVNPYSSSFIVCISSCTFVTLSHFLQSKK